MTLADLRTNVYLIYLKLSACAVTHISEIDFPNLQHLDLSRNDIRNISMHAFLRLSHLRVLLLVNNPLQLVTTDSTSLYHYSLRSIDFSFTKTHVFNGSTLSHFLTLQKLNLSHSLVKVIDDDEFNSIPTIETLDLTATDVK
jgi:Leucine-rich repeat (LRR) protein